MDEQAFYEGAKWMRDQALSIDDVVATEGKCCDWFLPDSITSLATKCQKCGKEKWEHEQH